MTRRPRPCSATSSPSPATGSAVVSGPGESSYADLPVLTMGDAQTRYHISLDVEDRSGVLAQVAAAFADHDVSIETVRQQLVARR